MAQGFLRVAAWASDNPAFAGAVAYLAPCGLAGTAAAVVYSSGFLPVELQFMAIFAKKDCCVHRAFV